MLAPSHEDSSNAVNTGLQSQVLHQAYTNSYSNSMEMTSPPKVGVKLGSSQMPKTRVVPQS